MASLLPITAIDDDGQSEIVFQFPLKESQWTKLKLRNKSNRLVVFRVRYEAGGGGNVENLRVLPTDVGVLSPLDTQPFELSISAGVDIKLVHVFVIEMAFVPEKSDQSTSTSTQPQPQPQKAVLDATEIWKSVGPEKVAKRSVPIRFDPIVNVASEERSTIYVNVIDPSESKWALNWRAFEIYGYARTQNPQECNVLNFCVVLFAIFWFAVGLLLGLKLG